MVKILTPAGPRERSATRMSYPLSAGTRESQSRIDSIVLTRGIRQVKDPDTNTNFTKKTL